MQEIIELRLAKALAYEEYLQRIAELAARAAAGQPPDTPAALDSPGKRALYNNLKTATRANSSIGEEPDAYIASADPALDLALRIDTTVKAVRPDGWRGIQSREQIIKAALYGILQDVSEVERIFLIIQAQTEY